MRHRINLDCKTNHVAKDGTFPILLRVSINGEHSYFNIGSRIKDAQYDRETKSVKSGINGYTTITKYIDRHKLRIEEIIDDFDKKGEIATLSKVKEIYERKEGNSGESTCFYKYVENKILLERAEEEKSSKTLDNYDSQIIKLKTYREKLSIHEVVTPFIKEYVLYLKRDLGQSKNTVYHTKCFLRKYTKMLFKEGKIFQNPFDDYKVGTPFEVEPQYLEQGELKLLHDLYDSKELLENIKKAKSKHARDFNIGEKQQAVLRYFLVACYTGFRHSDIKTLKREHIKGKYIEKTLEKGYLNTKKRVKIPIRKRLYSLLDMNNPNGLLFENPVYEDSQTNKYLKQIIKYAKIDKNITFHKARYTFAIISLIIGMNIITIKDILGHSELSTTLRYAKVADSLRDREMDKWDKLAKEEFDLEDNHEVICPQCENPLLKFAKNVIRLIKMPCQCPNCETQFIYNLKECKVQFANNEVKPELIPESHLIVS